MWRRVKVIPLPRSFLGSDRDNELEAKLAAELPGILNWLIEGAVRYTTGGLGACAKVAEATKKLRNAADTVRAWLNSACTKDPDGPLQPAKETYEKYVIFTRNGRHTPLSLPKFNAALKKKGMHHVPRNVGNFWRGFRVRNV